jgi:hypothetical protein
MAVVGKRMRVMMRWVQAVGVVEVSDAIQPHAIASCRGDGPRHCLGHRLLPGLERVTYVRCVLLKTCRT